MNDLQSQLNRLRVIQALRFTLLSGTILIVAALADLSTGIATLVPGIMFVLFLKDETFQASLALLAGVVFGGVVVLLTSYFWTQVPLIFLIVSMIVVFALAYWAAQGIRGRWRYIAFPIGAELCLLSAIFAEMTGAQGAIEATYVWLVETPIGVLLFWILLIGLWQSPSAIDLEKLIDAVRCECAPLLRRSIEPIANGMPTTFVPSPLSLKFFGDLTRMLDQNAGKFRNARHDHAFLQSKLEILTQAYSNIRFIQRSFEDLPSPGLDGEMKDAITEIMSSLADGLAGEPAPDTSEAFETVRKQEQAYSARGPSDLTDRRLAARLSGFVVAAEAVSRNIRILNNPDAIQTAVATPPPNPAPSPFFMMDSLQAATKIVLGVLIGLLVFMITDLPANSYLVIIILIVLVQPNLGRAHLRLRLWFPGVLAGSLWAIAGLVVLSVLPHFGIYLVWILPGLFLAGYLGSGPDRISYVGIQLAAGMATILGMAVFQIDNVLTADARLLGAVVGFLIALTVYHLIWPVHPATLLRRNTVRNMRAMARLIAGICEVEADEHDPEIEAKLAAEVAALKLEIQADFGLLYDMSYMFAWRVDPAYDYRSISHNLGLMYHQVWCLHQAVSVVEDVDRRKTMLAPVDACLQDLTTVFEQLANHLDHGNSPSSGDLARPLQSVHTRLMGFLDRIAVETTSRERHETEYGVNTVSIIIYHLSSFADAMDTSNSTHVIRTAELAHIYEGADQ